MNSDGASLLAKMRTQRSQRLHRPGLVQLSAAGARHPILLMVPPGPSPPLDPMMRAEEMTMRARTSGAPCCNGEEFDREFFYVQTRKGVCELVVERRAELDAIKEDADLADDFNRRRRDRD